MTAPASRCLLLSAASRAEMLTMLGVVAEGRAASLPGCSKAHPVRAALVGPAAELPAYAAQAKARLAAHKGDRLAMRAIGFHFGEGLAPGKIAVLFPGEGSQRVGMLRETRVVLSPVGAWLDMLDAVHHDCGETLPTRLIHRPADLAPEDAAELDRQLFDIGYGGQITTAANLALFEVLGQIGIVPDAVLGHSNGEHGAAIAACMHSELERERVCTWLRDVSAEGRNLSAPAPSQAMFAVGGTNAAAIREAVAAAGAFVAMDNCPNQQVIAGTEDRVSAAVAQLASAGAACSRLPFARAYHTPLFAAWAEVLARHYTRLPLGMARLPLWSCLSARVVGPQPDAIRAAMAGQWTAPVQLRQTIEGLYRDGVRTFIEVGCDDKLSAFVQDTLRGRPFLATATLSARQGELQQFRRMLAQLHVNGIWIDPAPLRDVLGAEASVGERHAPIRSGQLSASAAAITRQQQLVAAAHASLARIGAMLGDRREGSGAALPGGAFLGFGQSESVGPMRFMRQFTPARDPLLCDHALGRQDGALPVLSFTTSLVIAAEAARAANRSSGAAILEQLSAERWLAVYDGVLDLGVECTPGSGRTGAVDVTLAEGVSPAFTARVRFADDPPHALPVATLQAGRAAATWSADRFYRDYAFHGPAFQALQGTPLVSAQGISGEAVVTRLPGLRREGLEGDPALLDIVGQLVALWLLEWEGLPPRFGIFPYSADLVVLHRVPEEGERVRCVITLRYTPGVGTVADADLAVGNRSVAAIRGLRQRLIDLPEALAERIFGRGEAEFSLPAEGDVRSIDLDYWRPVLARGGMIWARALAHVILPPAERAGFCAQTGADHLLGEILKAEVAGDSGAPVEIWRDGSILLGRVRERVAG